MAVNTVPRASITWEQHRGAWQGRVPLCIWDTEAWRCRTHQVRLERDAEPGGAPGVSGRRNRALG